MCKRKALISIIVPIYNSEGFLDRCIKSVMNQTFEEWELLLINDGSLDKSALICDRYAQLDSRIFVHHKNNGGVSSARNLGLDFACGKYVFFIDSDDELLPQSLSKLLIEAENHQADLVVANYNEIINNEILKRSVKVESDRLTYLSDVLSRKTSYTLWGKLFLKDLFQYRFIPKCDFGEDYMVYCKLVYDAQKITHINDFIYNYYRENLDSYTLQTVKEDFLEQQIAIGENIVNHFLSMPDGAVKRLIECFVVDFKMQLYFLARSSSHMISFINKNYSIEQIVEKKRYSSLKNRLFYYIFKKSPSKVTYLMIKVYVSIFW